MTINRKLWWFILLLFCQCASPKEKTKDIPYLGDIELFPTKTIDKIGDSIFIGRVAAFKQEEDIIMIAEGEKHRILVLDTVFKLKNILGKSKGSAPGEFNYAYSPTLYNHKIYAYDGGNQRINIFDKNTGNFQNSLKLPFRLTGIQKQFYIANNANIYGATDPEKNGEMLLRLDSNGKLIKKFGENILKDYYTTEEIKLNANYKIISGNNSNIIGIGVSNAVVEIYDIDGKKLNSFDLATDEPFKTHLKSLPKEIQEAPGATISFITDMLVRKNRLYILGSEAIEENTIDNINIKHISVYDFSANHCKLIRKIRLNTRKKEDNLMSPNIFYVTEDEKTIYTQGLMTKNLYVFKMP